MITANGPKEVFDFAGLGSLKADAARDPKNDAAIEKAAQQFEALFLQMMLKSMRDATPKSGLFDSQALDTFEQMYDKQIVMAMSERGSTGLAEMIEQFIRRTHGVDALDEDKKNTSLKPEQKSFPVMEESTAFPISEASTQRFLLNRGRMLNGGRDE